MLSTRVTAYFRMKGVNLIIIIILIITITITLLGFFCFTNLMSVMNRHVGIGGWGGDLVPYPIILNQIFFNRSRKNKSKQQPTQLVLHLPSIAIMNLVNKEGNLVSTCFGHTRT